MISGVDRAAAARLQPLGAARKIDLGPLVGRHACQHLVDQGERFLGVGRQLGAARRPADDGRGQPQRRRRGGKRAVDQGIGNARLVLHAVGQGYERLRHRPEIDHKVRLGRDQAFEAHGVAAAGEPAGLRQIARRRRQEFLLRRCRQTNPAHHHIGRQHIHQHRRGRPGDEHVADAVRQADPAVRRIDDRAALRPTLRPHRARQQPRAQERQRRAAGRLAHASPTWKSPAWAGASGLNRVRSGLRSISGVP